MVDFHTHILPGIDDGCQSVSESVTLLRMLHQQGIQTVAATPHFYADRNYPDTFLEKRGQAWQQLVPDLDPELPAVCLGAEIQYFDGISVVPEISMLKLESSDLLLLEMPLQRWTDRMICDVLDLNEKSDIQVVLAHIERYFSKQPSALCQYLRDCGVLMQSNISFFADWKTRHKALSMLVRGEIHMLGTDCHNGTTRPPNWNLLPKKAACLAKKSASYLLCKQNPPNTL